MNGNGEYSSKSLFARVFSGRKRSSGSEDEGEKIDPLQSSPSGEGNGGLIGEDDPARAMDTMRLDPTWVNMEWWHASMIMIAETISLGILGLPSVLATVGLIGGFLLVLGLGFLATYSGYVIGQFKEKHPHVLNMADAFEVMFKPLGHPKLGRELGGACQLGFMIFSMASHILTWIICFNTITGGATCSIIWGVVALAVFWLIDLPMTLKNVSYFSIVSFMSIVSAVLLTMIAIGIHNPGGSGPNHYQLWPKPDLSFQKAFLSVTNIIFAYAGHAAFFTFISEMREPKDFPKALALLQVCDMSLYIVVAVVCYRYGGQNIKSPALGSAGHTLSKVAFGLAIPTIVIAGVIFGHVCGKYIYVRMFRNEKPGDRVGVKQFISWALITLILWTIAFIIAESVPNFEELLGLVSALFASWFTYGVSGIFWLFLNRGQYFRNWKKGLLTILNVTLVLIGATICGAGLYASGYAINKAEGGHSWSCSMKGSKGEL